MAKQKETKPRIVVKIGTSSLTEGYKLSGRKINALVSEAIKLQGEGFDTIIVSSGAIAAGMGELGLTQRPRELKSLQATAAVGQNELMKAYGKAFARHGVKVAQVLLTREEFSDRKAYLNIKNTLTELLSLGVVPVINENDSVSVEEILAGDNDNLAAIVAVNLGADALVLLSDSGFKMKRGDEKTVAIIPQITGDVKKAAGGGGSKGKGGMKTKIEAAEKTMAADVDLLILDSKKIDKLTEIIKNPTKQNLTKANATLFPSQKKLTDREHWILFSSQAKGNLKVDAGARKALLAGGSLLPSGIVDSEGLFELGDVVLIIDETGVEFGKGIVNHSYSDVEKIRGRHSREIQIILCRKCPCEVVYHANIVFS